MHVKVHEKALKLLSESHPNYLDSKTVEQLARIIAEA
jgi:hypothetical protein